MSTAQTTEYSFVIRKVFLKIVVKVTWGHLEACWNFQLDVKSDQVHFLGRIKFFSVIPLEK